MTTPYSVPRFIPLTKWNQYYPDPSVSGLRWLVLSSTADARSVVVSAF
jgi:hypothetical protein